MHVTYATVIKYVDICDRLITPVITCSVFVYYVWLCQISFFSSFYHTLFSETAVGIKNKLILDLNGILGARSGLMAH